MPKPTTLRIEPAREGRPVHLPHPQADVFGDAPVVTGPTATGAPPPTSPPAPKRRAADPYQGDMFAPNLFQTDARTDSR